MGPFTVGLYVLFAMTALFYVVLFSFIFYWHLVKVSFVVVPMFFTFEFLAMGLLVVAIVSLIINYMPSIIGAAGI